MLSVIMAKVDTIQEQMMENMRGKKKASKGNVKSKNTKTHNDFNWFVSRDSIT